MAKPYIIKRDLLRCVRIHKRLIQQTLAERAGLSAGQLSRLDGGKIASPHFSTVERLSEVLDIDADDLLVWEGASRR
jgi:DNA-binding Xre family transcriptional regulator